MNNPVEKKFFGENGHHNETGTTAVTGSFYAVYVYEDAVFDLLTSPKNTGDAWTGYTVPAFTMIPGPVTAFTLASGKAVGLKNAPATTA